MTTAVDGYRQIAHKVHAWRREHGLRPLDKTRLVFSEKERSDILSFSDKYSALDKDFRKYSNDFDICDDRELKAHDLIFCNKDLAWRMIRKASARMTRMEKRLLWMLIVDDLLISSVSKSMGISIARVCQIRANAFRKLRDCNEFREFAIKNARYHC